MDTASRLYAAHDRLYVQAVGSAGKSKTLNHCTTMSSLTLRTELSVFVLLVPVLSE